MALLCRWSRYLPLLTDRPHHGLTKEKLEKIADTYHPWHDESPLPLGEGRVRGRSARSSGADELPLRPGPDMKGNLAYGSAPPTY